MSDIPELPNAGRSPIDPRTGRFTNEWWRFLSDLAKQPGVTSDQSAALLALAERVVVLEGKKPIPFDIQGLLSVVVGGSPLEGLVQLQLEGDADAPGNTYYYGTDASGTKGFFPVPQPVIDHNRITADGNFRVTADGALRITR